MRVHELAKTYGLPSREIITLLASEGEFVRSASSTLTSDQIDVVERSRQKGLAATEAKPSNLADSSPTTPKPDGQTATTTHDALVAATVAPADDAQSHRSSQQDDAVEDAARYLRALIVRAFEEAQKKGKDDWQVMSVAVLKNRFSQLTGEAFDQRRFGYKRVLDLALDFPDLIAVDETKHPPSIWLIGDDVDGKAKPETVVTAGGELVVDETVRIRSDLWRAVIDFDSGEPYYLAAGQAVPESRVPPNQELSPPLPTITPTTLDGWRGDFARLGRSIIDGRAELLVQLNNWEHSRVGTLGLPGVLRGQWNLYLKRAVVTRLVDWFTEVGIPVPPDLTLSNERIRSPEVARRASEEARLRQAIIDTVDRMSHDELLQIHLPAISLLRRGQ